MRDKQSPVKTFSLHPLYLAICCILAATPVRAQTTLPTVEVEGNRDEATLGLDQPSTGASRTGVSTRELPASFEQVGSKTIEERGDYQLKEAIERSTGLTNIGTAGNGGLSFSSRGFTGVTSVGVAEDGVRLGVASGTVTYPNDSWGYERIEVLRGPSSIVYGTGTVGATINAVRKQPSRTRSTELLVGYGTDNTARVGIGTTGGVGEIGSYRVDVYSHYSDGQRDLGRSKGNKFMGTLRLDPSSDLRFELLADYSKQYPERYIGTPVINGHIKKSWRDENYNASNSTINYEDKRVRARMEWQANDWLTIKDELYYFESDRQWKNIERYRYNPETGMIDRSDYMELIHDMDQTGNRLEAAIEAGGHRAVAGWETYKVNFAHTNNSPYTGSSIVSPKNPEHGKWDSPDPTRTTFDTDTKTHAFYLEDAWQFHDRWLLMAGWRRDLTDVSRHDKIGSGDFDKTLGGNSWRLGLTYQLAQNTNVYVQATKGHDPVTSLVTLNLANRSFSLTKAKQVEAGIKQQLPNGLGEWTAAVFRIKKDDIITRDPETPSISVQGGSQHSHGVELTAALSPWKRWLFEGNYTLLHARFDDLIEAGGADRSGNRPSNVPQQVANLWGHYRFGDWQASLGGRYVGKRYGNNANTISLPSYTVIDAALSWQYDRRTTFRLFGRNLADKVYANTSYGDTQFLLGEGRRLELVAEMAF